MIELDGVCHVEIVIRVYFNQQFPTEARNVSSTQKSQSSYPRFSTPSISCPSGWGDTPLFEVIHYPTSTKHDSSMALHMQQRDRTCRIPNFGHNI
jgi:hypothetical protein